jgi:glutathione S-transferase
MTLTIWGRPNSINVQKVMWAVGELGVAHERVDAGMAHGIVGEAWYAERNPNRLVPMIEDAGLVLWESNVIVRYLAAKHATGTLMPGTPAGRAEAEMWMDWQQTTLMTGLSPLFTTLIRTPAAQRDPKVIEAGIAASETTFRMLDRHLADRQHMVGAAFTVADIPVGAATYRWYALPIDRPELPHLRAWYERLAGRPAYQRHVMLPLT